MGIYFISHVGGHKYSANVMIYRRGEVGVVEGNGIDEGDGDPKLTAVGRPGVGGGDGKVESSRVDASNGVVRGTGGRANGQGRAKESVGMGEGSQCIWLARVRPEDCEGIIKHTILKGKVVKPERQLRGGFDRQKGLVSW